MRQERISVADMLPDKKNPRKQYEGIKELADSFSITPGRPGEPFNPPIVVQDGSKYRIVEGHRRHKAMKRLKTETCLVFVVDDLDEANTMAVMLATDEKQKLTDEAREAVERLHAVSHENVMQSTNHALAAFDELCNAVGVIRGMTYTGTLDAICNRIIELIEHGGERVKRPEPEVFGADGKPIRKGETVYDVATGYSYTVFGLPPFNNGPVRLNGYRNSAISSCNLTHTRPETQKLIDNQSKMHPLAYCRYVLKWDGEDVKRTDDIDCGRAMVADLLRRQRELDAKTMGGAR